MVTGTLFYNPKDKECKRIQKLLGNKRNFKLTLMDATSKDVSTHLYKDMRIDTLPALHLYHSNTYKVYQGCDQIKAFLSTI